MPIGFILRARGWHFCSWALLLACSEVTPAADDGGGIGAGSTSASGGAGASTGGAGQGTGAAGSKPSEAGAATSGGNGAEGSGAATSAGGVAAGGGGGLGNAGNGGVLPDTSDEIYDPAQLPRFEITLPAESMASINSETYVKGSLRLGDVSVSDIGVRLKGEGSLRTIKQKAAFKLKFDELVSKQTFHGLRRLTLNNMVEDPSFIAERLAYHVFRELGLPAPRCNSALVYVNGEYFGVYANVEAEDKTFLRRWFSSDDGNLYEEGQVDFTPGAETKFDLETNEQENDRSDLVALIAAVSTAKAATFIADVGTQLDMAHWLEFTAAEAAVNQWDMYSYTVFYPNNFRIYRDPTVNKFTMLPWGMDMSMKPFRDSGKPFIDVQAIARAGDRSNGQITAGILFRNCLASPGCKEAYLEVVNQVADAYEQMGLEALAKQYFAQLEPEITKDPRKEYSASQIKAGFDSLIATIQGRPAALRASAAP